MVTALVEATGGRNIAAGFEVSWTQSTGTEIHYVDKKQPHRFAPGTEGGRVYPRQLAGSIR